MRSAIIRLTTPFIVCVLLASTVLVQAQAAPSTLIGWAALPAGTLADGPQAGQKLKGPTTNGLKTPFGSQPVGNIVSIIPGDFANSWLVLSDSNFDNANNSSDYLMRIYTVEVSWHDANGGDGSAAIVDWLNLTDPGKKVPKAIRNGNDPSRPLSGGDFNPRALARLGDGTFWIAEATGPSLLHFANNGQLLDAPIALSGAGALQGMSKLPDNKTLVVAQKSGANVSVRAFDTGARALGGAVTFPLSGGGNNFSGMAMVNDHQAVVIEQDNRQGGAAQFKQVFLLDLQSSSKTPVADLLNISDPNGVGGQGSVFKFPFGDIAAIYPMDAQTLVIANDNNVPFGSGRNPGQADNTEYIAVQIGQPLSLDGAFSVPR